MPRVRKSKQKAIRNGHKRLSKADAPQVVSMLGVPIELPSEPHTRLQARAPRRARAAGSAKLVDYLRSLPKERRVAFARRVGTNLTYLTQLAYGHDGRNITVDMAVKIERASFGLVRCEDLLVSPIWDYLRWRPALGEIYDRSQAEATMA